MKIKIKKILALIIISSFFLIGCGEPEVKPNKQAKKIDNMVEDKIFSFEGAVRSEGKPIKSSETNKIYLRKVGKNKMKKYKIILVFGMLVSICITGCDKRTVVPEKTDSIEKIEEYKFEVKYDCTDKILNNVKDMAYIPHIKAFFDVDGKLIAMTYTSYEGYVTSYNENDPVYSVYGKAEDCYSSWFLCYKDNTCNKMKKKGESLKQDYEDFLNEYDMTTEELKEFMQYEYSLELSKHE